MKKIDFRAHIKVRDDTDCYDPKEKEFLESKLHDVREIQFTGDGRYGYIIIRYTDIDIVVHKHFCDIQLLQYTGVKDKHGRKIYEGYIIKIPDDYDTYGMSAGEKYEVYFAYGGFRMKPKYSMPARGYYLEDDGEYEIIGNIHDNPELLEADGNE